MAGNREKYLSYSEAWRRIDSAIAAGFYFEAVTLQESIIADRLLSFIKGVEPTCKVKANTNFGELIKNWRRLAGTLPHDDAGTDLGSRVEAWRSRRNEVVHGLVKSAPGEPTQSVDAFIEGCQATAVSGRGLAREVLAWHQRQLRSLRTKGAV